jgi:rhamnose utilization protein RhaD (predicted bifunctional aldolase and dehydrogenase)/NAD(P)-dependent dehydrogenase (short-subunit alcohol dehydrogenase family)
MTPAATPRYLPEDPMQSLWNDEEAARHQGDLAQRVYTSRLLGRDRSLVLHGGGNTSVKIRERNVFGDEEDILHVKASGNDLETIEEAGFTPVRLAPLTRLAQLGTLSDRQLVNELATQVTRAGAPAPSVETLLHALLPHKFVDHTHADAILAITNTCDGERRIAEIFGSDVVIVPYAMPGFTLARTCAKLFPQHVGPNTMGMVVPKHGLFSFGDSARESYERMIALVTRAEDYLARHGAWEFQRPPNGVSKAARRADIAKLRRDISRSAGTPKVMAVHTDVRALAFAKRPDVMSVSQQGPATPDHVIYTKRLPLVGRDVEGYARAYRAYFEQHTAGMSAERAMLDPAPRVVLDAELGMCVVGRSAQEATIVADIYRHTMEVIERATALGGFLALPAADVFNVEYWELEQAKVKQAGKPPPFTGEVALVTGAASGIGKACVEALLARGAAVAGLDIDESVASLHRRPAYLGIQCDVTSQKDITAALEATVRAFGGLDMLIVNAGTFPGGSAIASLNEATWRKVMSVNTDANLALLRESHSLLKLAPKAGRVVVIGSKNVMAPGVGAAAYSASKAALTQLARVAALEWAADGIRVNIVHPDAVFDTGIWTAEVLAARAAHYGVSVEQYKTRNLLRTSVTSRDVAELAAEMCGPLFAKTTGAQVPIDGGSDRVI